MSTAATTTIPFSGRNNSSSSSTSPESIPPNSITPQTQEEVLQVRNCRGRGRPSPMTAEQQTLLQAHFPEYERLLKKNNLHLGKEGKARDPQEVRDWLKAAAKALANSTEFQASAAPNQVRTPAEWETIVTAAFKNYKNNNIIKNNAKAVVQNFRATNTPVPVRHDPRFKAANTLLNLQMPTSKRLFETEVKEDILEKATELRKQNPSWNGGKAYQEALKREWATADQAMYESKAEHTDIFENQRTLPLNLMTALCGLTEGGSVGPCEVVCLVGFRNEENFVASWRLNAHHQVDENGDPFTPEFQRGSDNERAFNSLDRAWAEYCETVLPKHRAPGPRNAQGVPVLRDTTDLSNKQLAQEIVDFLNQIWQYSQPALSRSCFVPLSEIDSDPQAFYDTSKFQFPTSLAVERLSNSQLWLLGDYISSISNIDHPDPFVFKSKDTTTLSAPNATGGSSSMIPGPVAVAQESQESSASAMDPATQPSDVQGMGETVNSRSPATASTQDELTKSSTVPDLETRETTNTSQQVRLPLSEGASPISPNMSTTLQLLPVPPILSVTIALPTTSCNPSTSPVTTTPSSLSPLSEKASPPDDTPASSNSTTSPNSSMTTTTNCLTSMSEKAPPPDGTPAVDPPADIGSQPNAIHTGLASVDAPKRRGKRKAAAAQLDDTQGTR
ncbi:hypothetical protein F5050DRAFT_1813246, partial [Lentinula boryana]